MSLSAHSQNNPNEIILTDSLTWEQLDAIPEFQDVSEEAIVNYLGNVEIKELQLKVKEIDFLVFLGTWCEDSHHYIPELKAILKLLEVPEQKVHLTGLDSEKQSKEGLEKVWNVEFVPTIILLRQGVEIGRIIETPQTTLIEDVVKML